MAKAAYLDPNRLEDIMFLIQYLGFEAYSLEDGTKPDDVAPRSVKEGKWSDIARDHPEFFRLTAKNSCVLAFRYYLRQGPGNPGRLEPADVQQLVQNAMTIHERQAKRVEVARGWVTMLAAVIAAVTGVAGLLLGK